MTAKQFTTWAESAYGKYLPVMRMEVEQWLEDEWEEDEIDALRHIVLREHPSVYGKPPGYHEIEEMESAVVKLRNEMRRAAAGRRIESEIKIEKEINRPTEEAFRAAWARIEAMAREKTV